MGRAPCCEKVGMKKGRWAREEDEILTKWSLIAGHLPGRTDNEIKNYWNSHLSRRIYSFTKMVVTTGNEQPPPTTMSAATVVGGSSEITAGVNATVKKRKGRRRKSCMKKKSLMSSSPEMSNKSACMKRDVDNTHQDHLMTMAPAPTLHPAADVPFINEQFIGTRMHGSYVDNTGWNVMGGGGGGGETDDFAKLSGFGPHEWLDNELMRLDEFLMQGESVDLDVGLDGLEEIEREGNVQGFNQGTAKETEMETEKATVVTVSDGESNGEWYNCSGNYNNKNNSSSSSVNDWFDWDWTSGAECRNQLDEGENMLAWLWGSSCSWDNEEASDKNSTSPKDTQEGTVEEDSPKKEKIKITRGGDQS